MANNDNAETTQPMASFAGASNLLAEDASDTSHGRRYSLPSRAVYGVDNGRQRTYLRRRSSSNSWRSPKHVPSLVNNTPDPFTLAGPDDTNNLHCSHEPFVQPGYAELNPSYEQPLSAKPVWSLAKPLPRVLRPGMVPTKEELLEIAVKAHLPPENSQRHRLDVDPHELEQGRVALSVDPRKIAAQVADARLQRENNLMAKILVGDGPSRAQTRQSRKSSSRDRRASNFAITDGQLSPVSEVDMNTDSWKAGGLGRQQQQQSSPGEGSLHPVPEEDIDEHEPKADLVDIIDSDCPEDLHPLVEKFIEKEVHNHHTAWSVIRTQHREALAESLAVFVQLTVGFSIDLAVTFGSTSNPDTTAWGWGFGTMMAIYVSGGVSGAHLNPAITVMLWVFRGFPARKMPGYFAAQFTGAFFAAMVAYGVHYASIQEYLTTHSNTAIINSFVTSQRHAWIGLSTAMFNEFVGTVLLAITILALGDDQNAPPGAGMNSLIVGLVITCLGMTFSYQTGAALNPSRDFGPRLALSALGHSKELFTNTYWFYGPWVGALSGAMAGAFLYDFMIFTGGESPINYPLERTERAMKRSGARWKRRYRRVRNSRLFSRHRGGREISLD